MSCMFLHSKTTAFLDKLVIENFLQESHSVGLSAASFRQPKPTSATLNIVRSSASESHSVLSPAASTRRSNPTSAYPTS